MLGVVLGSACGAPKCRPANCQGCCYGDVCIDPERPGAYASLNPCGSFGVLCGSCASNEHCVHNSCVSGAGGGSGTGGGFASGGGFAGGGSGGGSASGGGSSSGGGAAAGGGSAISCTLQTSPLCNVGDLPCGSGCCPADHPYSCDSTQLCYSTEAAAAAACGTSCLECGPPTQAHHLDCENTATHGYDPACTCTPQDSVNGLPTYSGIDCGQHFSSPMFCCASSSNYPSSGSATCDCWYDLTWACESFGQYHCSCAWFTSTSGLTLTNTCNDVPSADGNAWYCCLNSYGNCDCYERFSSSDVCPSGLTTVSNCITPAVIGEPDAPSSCPSGTYPVSACSGF